MNRLTISKLSAVVAIAAVLSSCNGTKDRMAEYREQGNKLYRAGNYAEAQAAFEKVLLIDSNDSAGRYLLAEALSKQGRIDQAFEQYRKLIDSDANHVMARVRAGQLLLLNGRLPEAERLAGEAIALAPDNVQALVFQAGILAAKNSSDTAIATAEKALQLEPESADAILMLASIHSKAGNEDKAMPLLRQALDKTPDNEAMHLMLANLFLKNRMNGNAEDELETLVELNPDDSLNYRRLATFYAGEGKSELAERILRDGVKQVPGSVQAKLDLVDFLLKTQNADVAIAELLPMVDQQPKAYRLRFKLADLQSIKGDTEQAETTLREVIAQADTGPVNKARNALARVYVAGKRINEAKTLLQQVLADSPRDSDALILQGRLALSERRVADAIADFRSVLLNEPNNIQAMKQLASAHVANSDLELARENQEKVVAALPRDIAARQDLVEILLRLGQTEPAEQHVKVLLAIDQNNGKALEYLFKLRLAQKDWTSAQQVTEAIRRLSVDDAPGFYMSGLAYQAEGKLEQSIAAFKKALKVKPDAIEPLTQLIKSYIALDKIASAIEQLQKTVKHDGKHFVAYNLLGELYLRQGKLSEAERAFRKAGKIKPEWSSVYRNLARVAVLKKDRASAIESLHEGLEKTGRSPDLINDLAALLHDAGKHREVINLFEETYRQQPNSAAALNNLAGYLAAYGDSRESLQRAADLSAPLALSDNPNMLDTAAWIAFKQGGYDRARRLLEQAVATGPVSPLISYHLGMVYYKQGDAVSARNYLTKALSASSSFEGIDHAREVLRMIQSG